MNRLAKHRCYLVGPMDHCREEGKQWRQIMTVFLEERGVEVSNPYYKPLKLDTHSQELLEDENNYNSVMCAIKNKDYDEVTRRFKQVRAIDLRMVDKADFLVAYLNFSTTMTGTLEEIFTANRQRKPVIIISSKPKSEIPPWYFGALPHRVFFESIEEAQEYLKYIDEYPQIDLLGDRWVFFDYD